ncbi:hypothetical protein KR038_007716, partial [Drosophila bunnanda]
PSKMAARMQMLLLLTLLCGLSAAKHLGDPEAGGGAVGGLHHHQHHQHSASTHHRRRLQRDSRAKDATSASLGTAHQCEAVKSYFESIDIKSSGFHSEKGAICGGSCCNNATEVELRDKAAGKFELLLHHHTSSLRGVLETNVKQFQSHVMELAQQSENNTQSVFATIYYRMVPRVRQMIGHLYTEIMNHMNYASNYTNSNDQSGRRGLGGISSVQSHLEEAVHRFFVQLFPVAYHQMVHLNNDKLGELHEDYINCLQHNYDELRPFKDIPHQLQASLGKSVHMSNVFMNALIQAAEVLSEADGLYGEKLTDSCKLHLLKMYYCPNCNGHHPPPEAKLCDGYCKNVMRGCSAEYAGLLDSPWSSVVDALNNLVTTHILSDNGIITVIKQLQSKLSDAIMAAMHNDSELEQKVKKTCGSPSLTPYATGEPDAKPLPHKIAIKYATPPDPGMVRFLSTIDQSKEFYTNIVDNFCDEHHSREDHSCWTGDRFGEYNQLLIGPGINAQRYNPEVPFNSMAQGNQLNELVDKLIKIRQSIGAAAPPNSIQSHDIQSDMGHEGSGGGEGQIGDDEEEYGGAHGSGDGSGDGPDVNFGGSPPITEQEPRDNGKTSGSNPLAATTATWMLLTLVTMLLSSCS